MAAQKAPWAKWKARYQDREGKILILDDGRAHWKTNYAPKLDQLGVAAGFECMGESEPVAPADAAFLAWGTPARQAADVLRKLFIMAVSIPSSPDACVTR